MAPAFLTTLLEIFKSSPSALVLIVLILCVFGTTNNIMVTHSNKESAQIISRSLVDLKGSVEKVGDRLERHVEDTRVIRERLADMEGSRNGRL